MQKSGLSKLGRYKEAAEFFIKAKELNPNPEYLFLVESANNFEQIEQYENAIEDY
ncbi:MAG: hypothetical protein LBS83_01655 [Holosporales bacterium]|nr:hypothetical protein [Holosporales bacterium]